MLVPSGTNLLGLVQHLAVGERYWYVWHVAGEGADGDAVIERGAAQPSHVDTLTARPVDGERRTLRWVLAHTTTETTRQAGHADVLRELLDGVTGR